MAVVDKKVWPEFFQLILDGKKKFELRLADFECRPGDVLRLCEWDPRRANIPAAPSTRR